MCELIEVMSTIEAGLLKAGKRDWMRKKGPLKLVLNERSNAASPTFERAHFDDARVEEEDVEPAKFLANRFSDFFLARHIARIGSDDQQLVPQFLARRFEGLRISAGNGDTGTLSEKLSRSFQSDAAGSSSDERVLIAKPIHDLLSRKWIQLIYFICLDIGHE